MRKVGMRKEGPKGKKRNLSKKKTDFSSQIQKDKQITSGCCLIKKRSINKQIFKER